jgi:roadblock/LC7 domain-containing protein
VDTGDPQSGQLTSPIVAPDMVLEFVGDLERRCEAIANAAKMSAPKNIQCQIDIKAFHAARHLDYNNFATWYLSNAAPAMRRNSFKL